MTHTPEISARRTACSCNKWIAPPSPLAGETPGQFITRAFEAHREHVARWTAPKPAQESFFGDIAPQPVPETDQQSLFS